MLTECATFMPHSVFYCVYMTTLKRHDLFYNNGINIDF